MFSIDDTIVAIATPPGRGGLGVVRVSGPGARRIAEAVLAIDDPLVPRHATFTRIRNGAPPPAGTHLDQVVATYFRQPASYTGEDVVEISGHGSPVVLREIVAVVMAAGARLAEPGEFTLRAFLHGRIDLVQAEAVADLIEAVTPRQARAAFDQLEGTLTSRIRELEAALFDLAARLEASLDFPEEGYHFVEPGTAAAAIAGIDQRLEALVAAGTRGRLVREGVQIAIVGKPNVGKSSLFNALVGADRAIVAAAPGTTRDFITERVDLGGIPATIIDTAGERLGGEPGALDEVERAGVQRALGIRAVADLTLVVLDRSRPLETVDRRMLEQTAATPRVIVVNKCDLAEAWCADELGAPAEAVVPVSVRSGAGLEMLGAAIDGALGEGGGADGPVPRDTAAVTNLRHIDLLSRARKALQRARASVEASDGRVPEEFVLADLQAARDALEEITGRRTPDDLLEHIFGRFCIGK